METSRKFDTGAIQGKAQTPQTQSSTAPIGTCANPSGQIYQMRQLYLKLKKAVMSNLAQIGTAVAALESRISSMEGAQGGGQTGSDPSPIVPGETTGEGGTAPSSGELETINDRIEEFRISVEQLNMVVSQLNSIISSTEDRISSLETSVSQIGAGTGQQPSGGQTPELQTISSQLDEETDARQEADRELSNRIATLEQRTSVLGGIAGYNIQVLTQDQYDQLQEKDRYTLYFIVEQTV